MNDLSLEFKSKLHKLFTEKKFSYLEFEINSLGNIKNLDDNLLYLYAISKTLNPHSKKNDFVLASDLLSQIYKKNKKNLEPLYNLVVVSLKAEIYKKTITILLGAFENNPKDEKIIEGLAKLNYVLGNIENSYKFYKLLFEINPRQVLSRHPFLTLLNYHSSISQKVYLEHCKLYSSIIEKNHNFDLVNQFELTAFSNLDKTFGDEMTDQLKNSFTYWYDVFSYKDSDLIDFVRKKNINILIDLNGYTLGNRLNVFAERVAPIQILWLGYCNSTGLKNMDYLISDANCIKTDEENQYSEKIIYMPNIWNSMSKPSTLPDISELPFNKEKIFTFGSFNNFQKISNKTISIWSKILNNTNSRLILKNSIMDNEEINQNLKEKFFDNKVQKDKIHIINFQSKSFDHLSFYNKIDLALDTFPYNGVTTTFESVLMGVPVLTLKGFKFNSRCGESINKNLELENFIAENYDDYYFKAFNFYENKNYLNDLRKVLRNKAILSPLFDNTNFASVFSEKMKIVWDNFLKG